MNNLRILRDLLVGLLLDWIPNRQRPAHRERRVDCAVCSGEGVDDIAHPDGYGIECPVIPMCDVCKHALVDDKVI